MKVGITGHQNIGSDKDIDWVQSVLSETINRLNVKLGFTSLAYGADQLFAEHLNRQNIPYKAIIPCKKYESTFHESGRLEQYFALKRSAEEVIMLEHEEPTGIAFYSAGKKVIDSSDLMIAVWFGRKAKNLGGTGDAVTYAMSQGKRIIHINPETRKIVVI